ncbi:MAG TPA: hypothetical protein PKV21_07860 [bacterium]|nr:hypothetical protein [bacterium]HOM27405.1 hypothetical protein [bacterium]
MFLIPVCLVKDNLKFLFLSLFVSLIFIYFFTFALYSHYILLVNIPLIIGAIILIKNYPKKLVIFSLLVCFLLPLNLIRKRFYHFNRSFYKFVILKDHRINVHPLVFTVIKYVKPKETIFMIPDYCEVYFITKTESPWKFCGIGTDIKEYFKNELRKLIREKPPDYFYLEISIKDFEDIFQLKPDEYQLIHLEKNLFKFKMLSF